MHRIHTRVSQSFLLISLPLFLLAQACGGAGDSTQSAEQAALSPSPTIAAHRAPITSLTLSGGNVIDFYDYERGVLITESGLAYSPPRLDARGKHPQDLSAIWTSLNATVPVPQALSDLQARHSAAAPQSPIQSQVPRSNPVVGGGGLSGVHTDSPVGCNNGCCDWTWLSTFHVCQPIGSYSWRNFNWGWGYVNQGSDIVDDATELLCSATGTSRLTISVGDNGGSGAGSWDVPEANYLVAQWVDDWYIIYGNDPEWVDSSVNTQSNPHLHTWCGVLDYN